MRLLMREHEAREALHQAMLGVPNSDLRRITGCSDEAARKWKAGRRCPNAASLVNLARQVPKVREWLLSEIEN